MLQNYIHPAVFSLTFVLAAFYLSDIFSNIYYGLIGALVVSILVSTVIDLLFNKETK